MRIRGWGRDLNRVQKERVVDLPNVGFGVVPRLRRMNDVQEVLLTGGMGHLQEIRMHMTSKTSTSVERLAFQASIEEFKMFRDKIDEAIRFAEEQT